MMTMQVPFIKLDQQYQAYKAEIDAAIAAVLAHGRYVQGPEIEALEQQLADYVGVKHCVAVSSGTTAIQVILMALMSAGKLKAGDEVIVPDFSFFATAEVPLLLGLKPVFVDIDPATYNLDINAVSRSITTNTRVIMPVSLYGQCANMPALEALAKQHDIALLEDAAQSFGASCCQRRSCSFGTAAATSFFPSKPLGAYGDGGACFTHDADLAQRMRLVRCHGESSRYQHSILGVNARMATIQAAILQVKLAHFDQELKMRQQAAERYNQLLDGVVTTPQIAEGQQSAYAQYTIALPGAREQVVQALKNKGVPTAVHYPRPMHQQPLIQNDYSHIIQATACPHAAHAAQHVLSLPFSPWITEQEQQYVVQSLREVLAQVAV